MLYATSSSVEMWWYGIQIYRLFYIYLPQRNGSICCVVVGGLSVTHATTVGTTIPIISKNDLNKIELTYFLPVTLQS